MESVRWRRIGAVLLIIGGALEGAALGVGSVISPPSTTVLGAALLTAYVGGWLVTGAGLIATGYSLPERERSAAVVAGVLALVAGIVEAVQFVTGAPFGPAPTPATYLAYSVAVVVAALRLLSDRTLHPAARWSIPTAAIGLLASAIGNVLPLLRALFSLPGMVALPWVATAFAGVLLVSSLRQSNAATTRLARA